MASKMPASAGLGNVAMKTYDELITEFNALKALVDAIPRTDPGVANEVYIDEADANTWKVSTG